MIGTEHLKCSTSFWHGSSRSAACDSASLLLQNAFPNAYTLAIAGKQPFIMLNTGLLELLTPEELQGVIAHEVSSRRSMSCMEVMLPSHDAVSWCTCCARLYLNLIR